MSDCLAYLSERVRLVCLCQLLTMRITLLVGMGVTTADCQCARLPVFAGVCVCVCCISVRMHPAQPQAVCSSCLQRGSYPRTRLKLCEYEAGREALHNTHELIHLIVSKHIRIVM